MLVKGTTPSPNQLRELVKLAETATHQARQLGLEFEPCTLEKGLTTALEYLSQTTRDVFEITCSLHADPNSHMIDKRAARHLFRIAQEAVIHAIYHEHATHIEIQHFTDQDSAIVLVISNGDSTMASPGHNSETSLRYMRRHAQEIGADLIIIPGPVRGTIIEGRVCMTAPSAN